MKVLICAGDTSSLIADAISKKTSESGVELLCVENISDVDEIYNKGEYFDRAVFTNAGMNFYSDIRNLNDLRDNIYRFVRKNKERDTERCEYVFLTEDKDVAKIAYEETASLRYRTRIILRDGPYKTAFLRGLAINSFDYFDKQYIFEADKIVGKFEIKDEEDTDKKEKKNIEDKLNSISNDFDKQIDDMLSDKVDISDATGEETSKELEDNDSDEYITEDFEGETGVDEEVYEGEDEVIEEEDEILEEEEIGEEVVEETDEEAEEAEEVEEVTDEEEITEFDELEEVDEAEEAEEVEEAEEADEVEEFDELDELDDSNEDEEVEEVSDIEEVEDTSDDEVEELDEVEDEAEEVEETEEVEDEAEEVEEIEHEDFEFIDGKEETEDIEEVEETEDIEEVEETEEIEEEDSDEEDNTDNMELGVSLNVDTDLEVNTMSVKGGKLNKKSNRRDKKEKKEKGKSRNSREEVKTVNRCNDTISEKDKEIVELFGKRSTSILFTGHRVSGKTTILYGLANILAKMNMSVLIVDLDTEHKGLSYIAKEVYDTIDKDEVTLTPAINFSRDLMSNIRIIKPGIHYIGSGFATDVERIENVVNLDKFTQFMISAKKEYNYILVEMDMESVSSVGKTVAEACDEIFILMNASNYGAMSTINRMRNIENEEVEDILVSSGKTGILFNMDNLKSGYVVCNKKIKNKYDILKAMDEESEKLIGEEPEWLFQDIKIIGEIPVIDNVDQMILSTKNVGLISEIRNRLIKVLVKAINN